jgi:hypothetical protein
MIITGIVLLGNNTPILEKKVIFSLGNPAKKGHYGTIKTP